LRRLAVGPARPQVRADPVGPGFWLCSILAGQAYDAPTLIAARFATGIGLAGALPNRIALAAENSA
jgi:MFS family permease